MKCPLFAIGDRRIQLGEETELGECLQAECAWFDAAYERCAVLTLAQMSKLRLDTLERMAHHD